MPGRGSLSALGRLLVAAAVLALPGAAWADCSDYGLDTWPAANTPLPANGRIVLEGSGTFQRAVETLAERRPVLDDGEAPVPLHVAAVYAGQHRFSQVVLVPTAPLVVGHRYQLRARPPKEPSNFKLAHFRLGEEEALLVWTVAPPLESSPAWPAPPTLLGVTSQYYGCGPALFATVAVPAASGARFLAELRAAPDALPRRALLTPESSGELHVGHGMCRGAFALREGVAYELSLSLVDLAGHVTPMPGPDLHFVGPARP